MQKEIILNAQVLKNVRTTLKLVSHNKISLSQEDIEAVRAMQNRAIIELLVRKVPFYQENKYFTVSIDHEGYAIAMAYVRTYVGDELYNALLAQKSPNPVEALSLKTSNPEQYANIIPVLKEETATQESVVHAITAMEAFYTEEDPEIQEKFENAKKENDELLTKINNLDLKLKESEKQLADIKVKEQELREKLTAKDSEIVAAIEGSKKSLKELEDKLTGEKNAVVAGLQSEHAAKLAEITKAKDEEIAALKADAEAKIAKLNEDHAAEISRLKIDFEKQISEMMEEHEAEIAELKIKYDTEKDKLRFRFKGLAGAAGVMAAEAENNAHAETKPQPETETASNNTQTQADAAKQQAQAIEQAEKKAETNNPPTKNLTKADMKSGKKDNKVFGTFPDKRVINGLNKSDFTFDYVQAVIVSGETKATAFEAIVAPLSMREEYPDIIIWVGFGGKKAAVYVSGKDKSVTVNINNFQVKFSGQMDGDSFIAKLELQGPAAASYKLLTRPRHFGKKGHLLLTDAGVKIHIIPATFKNNEEGSANFIYAIDTGHGYLVGDNSQGDVKVKTNTEKLIQCSWNDQYCLYATLQYVS